MMICILVIHQLSGQILGQMLQSIDTKKALDKRHSLLKRRREDMEIYVEA